MNLLLGGGFVGVCEEERKERMLTGRNVHAFDASDRVCVCCDCQIYTPRQH